MPGNGTSAGHTLALRGSSRAARQGGLRGSPQRRGAESARGLEPLGAEPASRHGADGVGGYRARTPIRWNVLRLVPSCWGCMSASPELRKSRCLWGKETRSGAVSGVVLSIWWCLRPDPMRMCVPRHHSGPTCGASARSRSRERSSDRRTITRLSSGRLGRKLRHIGKPPSGMHLALGAWRSHVPRARHGSVRRSRPSLGPRHRQGAQTGGPPG